MNHHIKDTVLRAFEEIYEQPATMVAKAPGRVNLIGEHTDYNDGFVLPCALNFATYLQWVQARLKA